MEKFALILEEHFYSEESKNSSNYLIAESF